MQFLKRLLLGGGRIFHLKKAASWYSTVVFPQYNMSYCSISYVTASLCHQMHFLSFSLLRLYFEQFEKSK